MILGSTPVISRRMEVSCGVPESVCAHVSLLSTKHSEEEGVACMCAVDIDGVDLRVTIRIFFQRR